MTASKDAVNARQLKILKMDTLHLNHYLNEMMLENPVIEIEENLTGYTDEDMRARKAEWLESNDFEEGLGYFDKETELPEAEDPDYALLNMHEGKTLEQHLRSQISSWTSGSAPLQTTSPDAWTRTATCWLRRRTWPRRASASRNLTRRWRSSATWSRWAWALPA